MSFILVFFPYSKAFLPFTIFIFFASRAAYRLYWHPLRLYPGPKLASATSLVGFYYNWFRKGQFLFQIERWHKQYGPVVRISPNELHFDTPELYDVIYGNADFPKCRAFYGFMSEATLVGQLERSTYRPRRSILGPFFTRKAILEENGQEKIIRSKINNFVNILRRADQSSNLDEDLRDSSNQELKVLPLTSVLKCLTLDIISEIVYSPSDEVTRAAPHFRPKFIVSHENTSKWFWLLQRFPLIRPFVLGLPRWVLRLLFPRVLGLLEIKDCIHASHNQAKSSVGSEIVKPNIVTALSSAPGRPLKPDELTQESFDLITAATEIVANALAFGLYQLLSHSRVHDRLRTELTEHFASSVSPSLLALESLPYLSAVVKEALRLSSPIPGRLPRVIPSEGAQIGDFFVPGCTIVSMSVMLSHRNEAIFPQSRRFWPERWIEADEEKKIIMERNMLAFSRGPRQCIGKDLAMAEMRMVIAEVIGRFDLSLAINKGHAFTKKDEHDNLDDTWTFGDFIAAAFEKGVFIKVKGAIA